MNKKVKNLLENCEENYIFPFFWQHGETEEVLREYMKVIHESHIGAVCIESRPHPDFCGEQWWRDMDIILDEARKRNMKVWILDDSHFPTGYANGAMEKEPIELRRQSITCRKYDLKEKDYLHIGTDELLHPDPFEKSMIENYILHDLPTDLGEDQLFSLCAICLDKKGSADFESIIDLKPFIKNGQLDWKVPEGKWRAYALHLSRNFGYHRNYINMTDYNSCRVLIDAVYEPHFVHYANDFGKTIAGFFSDEPELGNGHLYENNDPFGCDNDYPWSQELENMLQHKLGSNFQLLMPLMWENNADDDDTAKLRYTYMDCLTQLVKKNFSEQIGTWCREHGVKYIGHLIEDDNHHSRTGSSLGHYFRGLAGQDMAGIDTIGGQVLPNQEDISYDNGIFAHRNGEFYHYLLGKLAASAAAIDPRKNGDSVCEIFGNYGWEEGVRLEKYLADHFLVRGINHFVPHAFSAKEFPDPDCPPHFYAHGNNPQYRHFGKLMLYINRVCNLISDGHNSTKVAILYHGEGDWTGECITDEKIGHLLFDRQIDYNIIPQDVFSEIEYYGTKIENNHCIVHSQSYELVLIPGLRYITKNTAEAIKKMKMHDVKVIFIERMPEAICDSVHHEDDVSILEEIRKDAKIIKLSDLDSIPELQKITEIKIEPDYNRLRYYHYILNDDTNVLFFVNEGTEKYVGNISFLSDFLSENGTIYIYDPWDNNVHSVCVQNNQMKLNIEPMKSCLFVYDAKATEWEIKEIEKISIFDRIGEKEIPFKRQWIRSICRSIDYPKFKDEKPVTLPDNLKEEMPQFSGFVCYQNEFQSIAKDAIYLEITDAAEGVEVFLNGKSLGIQIVPKFRFDLTGSLRDGDNEIRIEVATTLEREMSQLPNPMTGQMKEAVGDSGITGNVKLMQYIRR